MHHAREVNHILSPFITAWPDPEAVEHCVDIRASLEKTGISISQLDLWIVKICATTLGETAGDLSSMTSSNDLAAGSKSQETTFHGDASPSAGVKR
jgi:hypothetical protein